jgi:phospholipid/cholesterol/gamma-HCH transport system permease protein
MSTKAFAKPIRFAQITGDFTLRIVEDTGQMLGFFVQALRAVFNPPFRYQLFLAQAEFVGVGSLFIILLTGVFTGAVFTLQTVSALEQVGMESMVGSTVMLAVSRELAPVLTALMVTGRVGSAMATELGTMRVSEQIDAMEVMAVDPIGYLVTPRIFACALMVPALTVIFDVVAALGAYMVAIGVLGIDEGAFLSRIEWFLDPYDFTHGIKKAFIFGVLIAVVGCFKGFHAKGGARGVGMATTQAVVIGSISIFVLDYVLTALLLLFEV